MDGTSHTCPYSSTTSIAPMATVAKKTGTTATAMGLMPAGMACIKPKFSCARDPTLY